MSSAWNRIAASLALVAMLLIVAMPTVGRYFGGGFSLPGETVASRHHASMPGMESMTPEEHALHMRHMGAMSGSHHAGEHAAPAKPHEGHAGHDCEYCPLSSGLMQVAIYPLIFSGPLELAPWTVRAVVTPPLEAPVPALGAQGPPAIGHG